MYTHIIVKFNWKLKVAIFSYSYGFLSRMENFWFLMKTLKFIFVSFFLNDIILPICLSDFHLQGKIKKKLKYFLDIFPHKLKKIGSISILMQFSRIAVGKAKKAEDSLFLLMLKESGI